MTMRMAEWSLMWTLMNTSEHRVNTNDEMTVYTFTSDIMLALLFDLKITKSNPESFPSWTKQ